jgi:hypothetical protein
MFVDERKLVVAAVLCAALGAARAQEAETQARTAAVADGVTSIVGIAAGAPFSPLLPVVGLAFKAAAFEHARSLPDTERPRAYALAAAGWQGSAAGNVCAAASVLSGGAFLPACIVVGVAWGWRTWSDSEPERRNAERCAALRVKVGKPTLRCTLMVARVERPVAQAPRMLAAQDLVAP